MSDPQSPDLLPGADDLGLSGKVAIVTGGGAPDDGIGNGRAAAMLLARAGARVLVVDIVPEAAAQTVAMIAQEGGTAAPGEGPERAGVEVDVPVEERELGPQRLPVRHP